MRQIPKLQDKKLKGVLKSRESVLGCANANTTKRKRTKIASSRLATCRSKLQGPIKHPEKRKRRLRDQKASIAKGMAELHIPFITPTERHSLSEDEILTKLRWSTPEMPLDEPWDAIVMPGPEVIFRDCCQGSRPDWNVPPRASPDQEIRTYVEHLYRVGLHKPGLQLPEYWTVFSSVDWDQSHLFPLATSSSENSIRHHNASSTLHGTGLGLALPREARIHCHMRSIHQPRVRMQWQLMQSMRPSWFKWRHQTESRSKQRHSRRNVGPLDYNQRSPNTDIWPQTAMSAFLRPLRTPTDAFSPAVVFLNETQTAEETGRLIMDVVATDAFPSQSRESPSWPPLLSQGMQSPVIDYTCRAKHNQSQSFQPLLFAAQRRGERPRQAFEELAMAFQPMMTLFILYYLDTRTHPDEAMPYWMVLFGAVYYEDGLSVQAYHPSFNTATSLLEDPNRTLGWGASSLEVCYERYMYSAMCRAQWERGPALELLRNIQGHCNAVLDRLKQWDGYDRACERILLASTR